MRPEDILKALNDADDNDIKAAEPKKRSAKPFAVGAGVCAAAVAGVIIANAVMNPADISPKPNSGITHLAQPVQIAKAVYPQQPKYPTEEDYARWDESSGEESGDNPYNAGYNIHKERRELKESLPEGYNSALIEYTVRTAPTFAPESESNFVYSPTNTYIALSMLSEVTGGETSAQLSELLGAQGDELRESVSAIWRANYLDNGHNTSLLSNSLWLSDEISYNVSPLQTLAGDYFASSFCGEMGSEEYNKLFRGWINDSTGGLLKEQAQGQYLPEDALCALVSSIYYQNRWQCEFYRENTTEEIFKAPDGEITCEFMNANYIDDIYFGEGFTAYSIPFDYGTGEMRFVLPDEGSTALSMLSDQSAMDYLTGSVARNDERYKSCEMKLSVPKFDITSELELSEALKALGITDVFGSSADFSPLADAGASLSKVVHDARITIDEDGCTAAAFTTEIPAMGGIFDEYIKHDFILDRPFAFSVVSETGETLFLGTVSAPRG